MEHSLSALLPVRNAEATLEGAVLEILEVLPELTSRFELVIVDDCSCDATIEVADELGGRYPQLVVVRHARPQGRTAAIQTGLRRSRGEVIFVADEDCELSLGEVRKVWDELSQHELILGRPAATRRRLHFSHRTIGAGRPTRLPDGLPPGVVSVASAMADQGTLLYYLRRNGLQWHEVEISDRTPRLAPRRIAAMARSLFAARRRAGRSIAACRSAAAHPKQAKAAQLPHAAEGLRLGGMKRLPPKGRGGRLSWCDPKRGLEGRDFFQPRLAATSCHVASGRLSWNGTNDWLGILLGYLRLEGFLKRASSTS